MSIREWWNNRRRPTFTHRPQGRTDVVTVKYATEKEVLDFANKVRRAGGANALAALLPGRLMDPHTCLIANALNFSCTVGCLTLRQSEGGPGGWYMGLPGNMTRSRAEEIAKKVGCEYRSDNHALMLPQHIGNAADAFDTAVTGWTLRYRIR